MIALVGPSGAGKSTLVDLIVGILPPDEGLIKVEGVDISRSLSAWRGNIGYVSQSFNLLDDTIRCNVALDVEDENIDSQRVWGALSGACHDSYVKTLHEGIETRVGDREVAFSGGQRQRIAIVRALYRKPRLLILDESTSSLDPPTEDEILSEVQRLKKTMSIILITHRMNGLKYCDQVYYLKNGRIMRSGILSDVLSMNKAAGDDFFRG